MKYTLVILTVLGLSSVALAGVGVLTAAEEADVIALWAKVCGDETRSEDPQAGDLKVYCKNAPDVVNEIVNHQISIPGTATGEQIVFIRPPPVTYKHNVEISGGGGTAPKTKIYVLPGKSQHEITSEYNAEAVVTQKPTVYFLKNDGQNYRYGDVPADAAGYA